MSLFTELKNRKVFRVAIAYTAIAWLLLQVVDILQDPLRLPDWTLNLFLALALFGFPLALILSWALELSHEGIGRADGSETSTGARIKFGVLIMLLLIGLGGALWVNWRAVDPEYRPAVRHSDNHRLLTSLSPCCPL